MKVVLSPNPYRDKGLRSALAADRILKSAGISTVMCLPFALEKGSRLDLPKHVRFLDMQTELKGADRKSVV